MSEKLLTENEMRGFLEFINKQIYITEPKERTKRRINAVIEHFFTKVLHPDMPLDYCFAEVLNLQKFVALALEGE